METLPATVDSSNVGIFSAFNSVGNFEAAQRMAALLAKSDLVPEAYRGNIANCVIGLEIANRIGASPLAILQNLYIVHGRPAWSSQFLIACINSCGRFSPLRYVLEGDGDDKGCYAWAKDKTGERLEGPRVTIGMAKAEGWFGKNGSKWKTMPELMLRYRAATLFARLYSPEITMGMHTEDEVIDVTPMVAEAPVQKAATVSSSADEVKRQIKAAKEKPASVQPDKEKGTEAAKPTNGIVSAPMVQSAVGECGLTMHTINDYLRGAKIVGGTGTIYSAPLAVQQELVSDPKAFRAKVSLWVDEHDSGETEGSPK